ncbi:hypothetical protein [Streptomyces fulvoviolaceus]|uniref:hypothetical protein n=1 Tax=Streptomyces fulvoviolaceus TaxID=285535 RepID=UPI0021C065F5|nr:hypothetical protein [Streptomyces fulvoviolaceus]MCT9078812.1 hypothetical protein [Streptomyces fulvoviolaceus]
MKSDPTRKWIRRASTASGLAYTAIAEYELARRLGARPPIAVMLPMSIDCYVIAALKWFKALDVALSLILMCAAQVAAHALEAGVVYVTLELVTVVSLLVPVALWRTHALARNEDDVPAEPTKLDVIQLETSTEVERVPEAPQAAPVQYALDSFREEYVPVPVLAADVPRTRVSVPVSEDDDELVERARAYYNGQIPTYRDLKETYGIGQARAKRIRAVLESELS